MTKAGHEPLQRPKILDTWTVSDGGIQGYFDNVDRWHCWWDDVEEAVIAHGMPPEEYASAMAKAAEWWEKVMNSSDPRSECEALDTWAMKVLGPYDPFEWEFN